VAVVLGSFLLSPSLSLAFSITEVKQDWTLDSDFTGSLNLSGGAKDIQYPNINLNSHKMTIDGGGITINGPMVSRIFRGPLTSNDSFLTFYFKGIAGGYLNIDTSITDSTHKVGVKVVSGGNGAIFISGNRDNTFTGNLEISGSYNSVVLNKSGGAIAVQGDIYVSDGGMLRFSQNQQISRTSSVRLKTRGWVQFLSISDDDIKTSFKNLTVDDRGALSFNHEEGGSVRPNYYIFIDNLVINEGGRLDVYGWKQGRDFLLVRKNSQNLADALTKMELVGYDPANIHLRDFNNDYWQISALPEPATYGALLAAAGLGLWTWRKRHNHTHPAVATQPLEPLAN